MTGNELVIRDTAGYLIAVRDIRALAERIESIESVEEAKTLADRAAAAKTWAERARLGTEQVNLAAMTQMWAQRRAGELLKEMPKNVGGRPTETPSRAEGVSPPTLAELGVTEKQSSEWQKLADVPIEDFQAAIEDVAAIGIVSTAKVVAVLGSSESVEWYTPVKYIDAARRVMGGIDLDPASCEAANELVRAERIFTAENDGLAQEWTGRVFMNPPYGRDGSPFFVAKLLDEFIAGHVTAAVLLCAARLETQWFQPLFDHLLCFPNHRVRFWQPGRDVVAPPFTPAFAYLGTDRDAFIREFSTFGPIVSRVG